MPSLLLLIAGTPFVVAAALTLLVAREERDPRRWDLLGASLGMLGFAVWAELLIFALGVPPNHLIVNGLCAAAWLMLLLAMLPVLRERAGWTWSGRWVGMLAAAVALGLLLLDDQLAMGLIAGVLGVPAAGLTIWLAREAGEYGVGTRWRMATAGAAYLATAMAWVGRSLFHGANTHGFLMPAEEEVVLLVLLVAGSGIVLCAESLIRWQRARRPEPAESLLYFRAYIATLLVLVILIIGGGSPLALHMGALRHLELEATVGDRNRRIASMFNAVTMQTRQIAVLMSTSSNVVDAMTQRSPESREVAEKALNRYRDAFELGSALVLNDQGVCIATDRTIKETVGLDLSRRWYFQSAMTGTGETQIVRGTTTGIPGIYAGSAVRDDKGRILGVAVVKIDLEAMASEFTPGSNSMLVDPGGRVWLASSREWTGVQLWKPSKEVPTSSPADPPVAPVIPAELAFLPDSPLHDQQWVRYDGGMAVVDLDPAGPKGWAVISLGPLAPVFAARCQGMLLAAATLVLMLGVATAIQMRQMAAWDRQRHQRMAESLAEMERVVAVLSHDLRTPLQATQMTADYLQEEQGLSVEAREMLRNISQQQAQMADMVGRMLDLVRLRSGETVWKWGPVNLRQTLETAVELVRVRMPAESEVRVCLTIESEPEEMTGDAMAIRRLVTNLVNNAVAHTARGEVAVTLRRLLPRTPAMVEIAVSDTGEGIEESILPLLGKPFALNAQSHKGSGSGLGIAIASGICAAHGGRLRVSSVWGKGSVFAAWLRTDLPAAEKVKGDQPVEVVKP